MGRLGCGGFQAGMLAIDPSPNTVGRHCWPLLGGFFANLWALLVNYIVALNS